MSLTITVPDEIAQAVEELANRSGETPESILLNALWAHFPPIPSELQEEFDALERATSEDLTGFESHVEG